MHRRMVRKRRVERAGLTRVRADGLDADAEHVPILGEHTLRDDAAARVQSRTASRRPRP
jgi:hypothetical protein